MITPDWTTSRKDLDSFTNNPETGTIEHVVYVYRGDQPRIAVFAGPEDNARDDARAIAEAVNGRTVIGDEIDRLESLAAAANLGLDAKTHVEYLARGIQRSAANLKDLYVKIIGENPWDT